jgi:pimeloyl-ACP methyl ester carboxylesterase
MRVALLLLTALALRSPSARAQRVTFIAVERDVKLEVLDWGGSGRPVVLLAGFGNTAHIFDQFATKLTTTFRVYGITRRGFGASSAPSTGYDADRLGDDVLAVIDSLGIAKPVLIGHSIAGQELSSIGSRHPEKVAGLVYLDAAYGYAYYDSVRGDSRFDLTDLIQKLPLLRPDAPIAPSAKRQLIKDLLETDLPRFQRQLQELQAAFAAAPVSDPPLPAPPTLPPIHKAIMDGQRKYTRILAPALAIYALPHQVPAAIASDSAKLAAYKTTEMATTGEQAIAFEKGVPSSHVVRIPFASHYVFRSHETDVLREIQAFVGKLP